MDAVLRERHAERRARALGGPGIGADVVVDHRKAPVAQGHGVQARLVVRHIEQLHLAPGLAAVAAPARPHEGVLGAAEGLQRTVRVDEEGGLDALEALRLRESSTSDDKHT